MTTCTAQRSRARALPLLNLKKKRDCSQSTEILTTFSAVKGSEGAEAPSPSFALDPTTGSGNDMRRTLRKTSIGKESSERES